jgi:hypothetical protein
MARIFEAMEAPANREKFAAVGSEYIREQLAKPSLLESLLLPGLEPPFRQWREPSGVIHHVGTMMVTSWRRMYEGMQEKMETFEEPKFCLACEPSLRLTDVDYEPEGTPATCVRCVAYESERPWQVAGKDT